MRNDTRLRKIEIRCRTRADARSVRLRFAGFSTSESLLTVDSTTTLYSTLPVARLCRSACLVVDFAYRPEVEEVPF